MSLAYYGEGWSNDTSSSLFITPGIIENGRKQTLKLAIKRYFDGTKSIRDKRYFYNDGKKLIPQKQYEESVKHQKAESENSLAGLMRKGDRLSNYFGLDKLTSA